MSHGQQTNRIVRTVKLRHERCVEPCCQWYDTNKSKINEGVYANILQSWILKIFKILKQKSLLEHVSAKQLKYWTWYSDYFELDFK